MSFDLNITVNGSRCKQYSHQGKTFIEAKNGSEYVIEVKNNHWKRVLAVGAVDGLNVLTGKTASESDSGYIIGAYSSEKIKGFRFSDDEWAMFKFGYKFNGNTYAQSKEDGSEKNCGVIGIRFFYEKEPIVINTPSPFTPCNPYPWTYPSTPVSPWDITYTTNVNYTSNKLGEMDMKMYNNSGGTGMSSGLHARSAQNSNEGTFKKLSSNNNVANYYAAVGDSVADCCDFMAVEKERSPDFDMGTEWGRKEKSRVNTVTFERGCLAQSFDIYYASRESLIAMGVPIQNTLSVSLPQSFPNNYAKPPKGWNG